MDIHALTCYGFSIQGYYVQYILMMESDILGLFLRVEKYFVKLRGT